MNNGAGRRTRVLRSLPLGAGTFGAPPPLCISGAKAPVGMDLSISTPPSGGTLSAWVRRRVRVRTEARGFDSCGARRSAGGNPNRTPFPRRSHVPAPADHLSTRPLVLAQRLIRPSRSLALCRDGGCTFKSRVSRRGTAGALPARGRAPRSGLVLIPDARALRSPCRVMPLFARMPVAWLSLHRKARPVHPVLIHRGCSAGEPGSSTWLSGRARSYSRRLECS